ncbi:MAG: CpsD/CapB family tyrosine-protein kinase, partial [Planctomycetales bacterium]|nr:CpsD/CapB family tyrosine-protein kinase [Planctomycetales bacterium]
TMAVYIELRDKSFRSRADVQSRLGVRVLAQVPRFANTVQRNLDSDEPGNLMSPMLCTYHQPGSLQSEAFRSLRTALLFNPQTTNLRVLQVTSPSPGDGASTIAANLAISIAQLGRRVLLIDADLHRPQQHGLFDVTAEQGLASVITNGISASDAICETKVSGLSLLPAGPQHGSVSELFTSPQFKELLDSLRDEYDYVLLDTEPLLVVSDPCVIASQVDGVLLGLSPTKDSRWRAERASEILATIGVQPIGAVINGVTGTAAWGFPTQREFDHNVSKLPVSAQV